MMMRIVIIDIIIILVFGHSRRRLLGLLLRKRNTTDRQGRLVNRLLPDLSVLLLHLLQQSLLCEILVVPIHGRDEVAEGVSRHQQRGTLHAFGLEQAVDDGQVHGRLAVGDGARHATHAVRLRGLEDVRARREEADGVGQHRDGRGAPERRRRDAAVAVADEALDEDGLLEAGPDEGDGPRERGLAGEAQDAGAPEGKAGGGDDAAGVAREEVVVEHLHDAGAVHEADGELGRDLGLLDVADLGADEEAVAVELGHGRADRRRELADLLDDELRVLDKGSLLVGLDVGAVEAEDVDCGDEDELHRLIGLDLGAARRGVAVGGHHGRGVGAGGGG